MFERLHFSLARTMQLNINPFEHCIQITRDFRIPKADDTISFSLQPSLSLTIVLGCVVLIMMSAIELYDQMSGRTPEVDDIGTDRRLPPEVCAF
jgi:hypothetical protein